MIVEVVRVWVSFICDIQVLIILNINVENLNKNKYLREWSNSFCDSRFSKILNFVHDQLLYNYDIFSFIILSSNGKLAKLFVESDLYGNY